jgi:hypothetical protein
MKRLTLALGLAVPLVWAAPARAELRCDEPLFRAGEVRSGVPLVHRCRLANRGANTIELLEVKAGCGCLRPRLERRALPPGESFPLAVAVNALGQRAGPNTWRAVVHYRDGEEVRQLPLFVTATVVSEVSVRPAALVLATDSAIGHDLTLIDRRARPLGVKAVVTTSRHVRARAGEARRGEGGAWERTISLEVGADCPEGRHEEVLHIHTTDPDYPDLEVPYTVVKRAGRRVTAVPGAVAWTAAPGAPLPARLVLLGSADERPVRIERVEADSPALRCRWAPGPGPRATLRIELDRARLPGPTWEGQVRVHLSQPVPQVVTVPVRCSLP